MEDLEIKYKIMCDNGNIMRYIFKEVEKNMLVGLDGIYIENLVKNILANNNCVSSVKYYKGFPSDICVSVNDDILHGVPNSNKFKINDIVKVDIAFLREGYHIDCARTYCIGSKHPMQDFTVTALDESTMNLKAGVDIRLYTQSINNLVKKYNYYCCRGYTGHGIGKNLHMSPSIYNYKSLLNKKYILREGDTIAIEPIILDTKCKCKTRRDRFTVYATKKTMNIHFEDTYYVSKNGLINMTR